MDRVLSYPCMAEAVKPKRTYNAALRAEQARHTRQRILEAGRRLLRQGTYSAVTMEEIAVEAGVSYQTVYAAFGNKLRLAHAIVDAGWPHVDEARALIEDAKRSAEPRSWLRTAAGVARRINELCADLPRFMRESGDPALRARYQQVEKARFDELGELLQMMQASGRLRRTLTAKEAHSILWAFTGPDWYCLMVFERRWRPARFEERLAESLIELLLEPDTDPV